jgi:hypothetical protein
MNYIELNSWVKRLENTKPYKIVLKTNGGAYELVFLYGDYHYKCGISQKDSSDNGVCQKKILDMCSFFEQNIKIKTF